MRTCTKCKGSKTQFFAGFTALDGTVYADRTTKCHYCDGAGEFSAPDYHSILGAIKGRNPGKLRSARPKDRRAYYVWRMARFHGGADVTMPIGATMDAAGDPYQPELEKLSEMVARRVFRTDMAAAHRWGRALGYLDRDLPGLPASAYSGGPVADADKPLEELAELI